MVGMVDLFPFEVTRAFVRFREKPSAPMETSPKPWRCAWWAARQRAQQNLPKSLRLYSGEPVLARRPLTSPSTADPVRLVLDTNVVLDWLVFRDPASHRLGQAIGAGQACWLANEAMRHELEHVLTCGKLDTWRPDLRAVMRSWERFVTPMPDPVPAAPLRLR